MNNEKKPILSVERLTHVYGTDTPFEKVAVEDVSLDIYENDFIGVIGHTGSGKSTLIRHLNGLEKPSSGIVRYQGEDIWQKGYDLKNLRFRVGMVFQYPEHQLFEETVEKDIGFGPKNMGLSSEEVEKRVLESAEFAGLDRKILSKSPFDLSGGQKRRVAIAGIMAMRPDILILDEPTAGLDPKGRDEILAGIREYHRQEKAAVILVSHSMEDISRNAEKVLVMRRGKLEMFDSVREVFRQAARLKKIGLDVPQITGILLRLKEKGYEVDPSLYAVDEVADLIVKMFRNQTF